MTLQPSRIKEEAGIVTLGLFKVREYYRLKLVGTLLGPCRSTTKRIEVEQTHTHKTDYRNPPAHAPRIKYALTLA